MEAGTDDTPLVVILGVTGSGKSALGMELSDQFDGEIIAADSRTVYRRMDISTAKPTKSDRRGIRHHLLDVVYPDQTFTVADFKLLAQRAIYDVASRGKTPFLVGGTGLYIDALLYDFSLRPTVISRDLRAELIQKSTDELRQYILQNGLDLPRDSQNPRRLMRTIEANGELPQKSELRPDTLILGLSVAREDLRQKITLRIDSMIEAGLVDELRALARDYGWDAPALQTPGYKAFRSFIQGDIGLDEAKAAFVRNDMNLAKRQSTWFSRNKDVRWVNNKKEAVELVTTFLNKY